MDKNYDHLSQGKSHVLKELQLQQFHKADSIVKFTVMWFYKQR